jgi:alkylhydroperoxidase family enzyme
METPFLAPVEKPKGLMMRLTYFILRRKFGKVMTPLSVSSARMPVGFLLHAGKISRLDKKLTLTEETTVLLRGRVSGINGCLFCQDASRWFALHKVLGNTEKFDAIPDYRTSDLFTDAQRAALDYATELTENKHVDRATFDRLRKFYNEREVCEIAWVVASEHLYNIGNIGLNIGSDGLCEIPAPGTARKPVTVA